MTIQLSLKERVEKRKQEMQDKKSGVFLKWINDSDARLVRLITPYEGYQKLVTNKTNNTSKLKTHFRAYLLGDMNMATGTPLTIPQPNYSMEDVRNLRIEDAKIITAPESMELGILDGVSKKHSIFLIIRKGAANSTSTTYDVFPIRRVPEEELAVVSPNLKKEDIAKLDSEVNYEEMVSEVEMEALMNAGKKDSGGGN